MWQFEGHGYVPSGTSGFCIMQLFGSDPPHATTLMVRTYNDSLTYYQEPVLAPCIWDKWFQLNVIHDVEASIVRVYIDRIFVYEAPGHGGHSHYFKFGVYTQNNPTYYMESRWKGIRVFHKIHSPWFGQLGYWCACMIWLYRWWGDTSYKPWEIMIICWMKVDYFSLKNMTIIFKGFVFGSCNLFAI